jgi:hypothetical protein
MASPARSRDPSPARVENPQYIPQDPPIESPTYENLQSALSPPAHVWSRFMRVKSKHKFYIF